MICRYFNEIKQKNAFLFNTILQYNCFYQLFFIVIQFYITAFLIHTAGI